MIRLSVFGLVLATFLSTAAADPASDTCADDLSFRFNGENDKDCGWVGRNDNRCDRKMDGVPLRHYCPWVCNDCGDVLDESSDECQNNPGFRFNLDDDKTCLWVGKNPDQRCERQWRGSKNKYWCPEYCGLCDDSEDPVDDNNDGTCEDDVDFRYGNNPNRSCSDWVADDTEKRCFEYHWKGEPLSVYCPVTCDTCSSIAPTAAPQESSSDDEKKGCCSLDYKTCIGWCGPTEDSCNNCNHHDGVGWLDSGSRKNWKCKPRWTGCQGKPDNFCCKGLECRPDPNNWLACLPALETPEPTFAPSTITSMEPTEAPEPEYSEADGCCSLDYKECIGWCGPSKASCLGCNHHDGVGWLDAGSAVGTKCKRRWTGCEGKPDNFCCPGLVCRKDPNNWLACLPEKE